LGQKLENSFIKKPYDLHGAFGVGPAMRTFLVLALTGHEFFPSVALFGTKTWTDIECYHFATAIDVAKTGRVQLFLSYWQLRRALEQAESLSICYSSVLGPLGGQFDWKSFERLFVHLLACRVLALLVCEGRGAPTCQVTLRQLFPGAQMSAGLPETRVVIKELKVQQRSSPLVKVVKKRFSLALDALETGIIWLEADGNALVDAATCFEDADSSRKRRCFIQAKFSSETTIDPKQRYTELRDVIQQILKLDENCIPVFVTNRKTPPEHVNFLQTRRQFVLYNYNTIREFLGRSLHPLVPCAEFE